MLCFLATTKTLFKTNEKIIFIVIKLIEFLKRLQYKVNLVPVIAKADSLTKVSNIYTIIKYKYNIM